MKVKLYEKYSIVKQNMDHVITENENVVVKLSGEDSQLIIENIFPLLNGDYTIDEISNLVQKVIPQTETIKIIDNLVRNGLVYYTPDNYDDSALACDILKNLTTDVTRSLDMLSEISVAIVCKDSNLKSLAKDLSQFQFRKIYLYDSEKVEQSGDNIFYESSLEKIVENADFLIAIDNDWVYSELISRLNKICIDQQRPWLYCRFTNTKENIIGPIFTGKRVCYDCLIDRFRSNNKQFYKLDIKDAGGYKLAYFNNDYNGFLWSELKYRILIESVKYLLRLPMENLVNKVEIIDVVDFSKQVVDILPVPKCKCIGGQYLLYKTWDNDEVDYKKMLYE